MREMIIEVVLDKNNIVHSMRVAAQAFITVADEIEQVIGRHQWKPISVALKNGKTILARVTGGEHEPFLIYYDKEMDTWRYSLTQDAIDPRDFVGPLEWKALS